MRNRTRLMAAIILLFTGCATVDTGPAPDLTGTWTGHCQNCPVQKFTLLITETTPELRGTLQASPRTGLGTLPMALRDGKVAGRNVSFHTEGADGINLTVSLRVDGAGRRMEGRGSHRAGFPLWFVRE